MALLDPFERPPQDLMVLFKKYQKIPVHQLTDDVQVIDFARDNETTVSGSFSVESLRVTPESGDPLHSQGSPDSHSRVSYASRSLPGLFIVPSMLLLSEQDGLVNRLLHRDLANDVHQTNLHKHYQIPYELCDQRAVDSDACTCSHSSHNLSSFFNMDPATSETFHPLDPNVHKPLTIHHVLHRKLRWMTLGGQYDWTNKNYPDGEPPAFPADIKALVQRYFPQMTPEAAIVNFYSPGDTLSLHRDVSEWSDQGLVSISIGCDALFIVGVRDAEQHDSRSHILRLRSGDAVYMSGTARYAWHGVPRILPFTCPSDLQSWPAAMSQTEGCRHFESWRGWMATKRINLNVRQMYPR